MKSERRNRNNPGRKGSLLDVYIWFYTGVLLVIIGSIGTAIGPGVNDPLVRTLNTEIPAIGVSLIFLTYNHTIALLTFIAATAIITMILLRAILRLEEMGAEL
jgi:energy-converting hydrogenase A subunit E